jgi:glycosyltransferase involved in cell wall biosynthesis
MKTTIVFDPGITGHHLEYLNHLYNRAGEKADEKFIFVVHPEFPKYENYLTWPVFKNVVIKTLDESQARQIEGNILISSFRKSKLLKRYVVENRASDVFLISLMPFLPFLPLILSRNLKVSGIIYSIAARSYKNSGYIKKLLDLVKYFILSSFKVFDKIFLLNDAASARLMNRKYKCHVFHYLPDPVIPLITDNKLEVEEMPEILSGKKVFLHFGGLAARKGTIDILKSIELLDNSLLGKVCFIFAGRVNDDIKTKFRELVEKLSKKVQIMVYEGFCRYELLSRLCSSADYLLLPYRNSSQSSGILGFAARYDIPVLGTSGGLLGSLINNYKLGYAYKLENISDLAVALEKHILMPSIKIDGREYLRENTILNFQRIIFE